MQFFTIEGMSCEHCREAVLNAVNHVPGISGVEVNLETGRLSWTDSGSVNVDTIRRIITELGYIVKPGDY